MLRLDRRARSAAGLPRPRGGLEREDEMVAAFDYCLHGRGGAAPSIDTAMHALVDAAHVDHLHPDAGIALACAADGEKLTGKVYGDKVVWVPWRRPGFQLGLDIAAIKEANPQAVGTILGGHGITAWGDTSARGRGATPAGSSRPPRRSSRRTPAPNPFGPRPGRLRAPAPGANAGPGPPPWPRSIRGDRLPRQAPGRALQRRRRGPGLPRPRGAPPPRRARHVLPGPLPAHQGETPRPGPAPTAGLDGYLERAIARLRELHDGLPRGLPGLLRPPRRPGAARRSAAPTR